MGILVGLDRKDTSGHDFGRKRKCARDLGFPGRVGAGENGNSGDYFRLARLGALPKVQFENLHPNPGGIEIPTEHNGLLNTFGVF